MAGKGGTEKTCSKCLKCLPVASFAVCSRSGSGLQSWCKLCQNSSLARRRIQFKARTAIETPTTKKCGTCVRILASAEFSKNRANLDGLESRCRACMADRCLDLKRQFVAGYGGACSCCGETRIEFLTMEHKQKDGIEHRKVRQSQGAWRDAIAAGFPDTYTVLCYNCNLSETHGRLCPHKTEKLTLKAV